MLCSLCHKHLASGNIPGSSQLNNLRVSDIPEKLLNLNAMEQRLISRAHAYMKLVMLPYGQSAMNGQAINVPFDLEEMLTNKLLLITR